MKKYLIYLIISLIWISCSRRMPAPGKSSGNDTPDEPYKNSISILYPVNAENFRSLSEREIKMKAGELVNIILAPEQKNKYRSLSRYDFTRFVSSRLESEPQAQSLLAELESNGVYVMTGSAEESIKSSTRYGDKEHMVIARRGLIPVLKKFLSESGEGVTLEEIVGVGNSGATFDGVTYKGIDGFAVYVHLEDYIDPVFSLHTPISLHSTGVSIDDPAILGGITTITHFWNPDGGWNNGNKNIWTFLKDMINDAIGDHADDLLALMRPEYKAALLKTPPSAFYKALCLWYGWKTIQWREEEFITDYVDKEYEYLQKGLVDYLRDGDKETAAKYLAHVVHLLMDMSVPAHVLNDPHGSFGGDDIWEGGLVRTVLREIIPNESYRFSVGSGNKPEEFTRYTYKDTQASTQWDSVPGDRKSFYQMTKYYYDLFGNTYGLWPLFYNTAQATQFFPTYKNKNEFSKKGNTDGTAGNASWLLTGAEGFSGAAYNNQPTRLLDEGMESTSSATPTAAAVNSVQMSSNGTYFLVYNNNGVENFWKELLQGTVQGYIQDEKAYVYLGKTYATRVSSDGNNTCKGDTYFTEDSEGSKALNMTGQYCSGCQTIQYPVAYHDGDYDSDFPCWGSKYLIIPAGQYYYGKPVVFETASSSGKINVPTSQRTVLYSESDLEEQQIKFTLEDLVQVLITNNILPAGGKVEDLVEVDSGKVGLKRFTKYADGSNINPADFPIIRPVNVEIGGVNRLVDIKILDEFGYVLGKFMPEDLRSGKISLYFIEAPFDKMVEYLLPLTIATTTRLVRNYYRFYY